MRPRSRIGLLLFWMRMGVSALPALPAAADGESAILRLAVGARVRFALEVNRGWFERHAVHPGDPVQLEGESWDRIDRLVGETETR